MILYGMFLSWLKPIGQKLRNHLCEPNICPQLPASVVCSSLSNNELEIYIFWIMFPSKQQWQKEHFFILALFNIHLSEIKVSYYREASLHMECLFHEHARLAHAEGNWRARWISGLWFPRTPHKCSMDARSGEHVILGSGVLCHQKPKKLDCLYKVCSLIMASQITSQHLQTLTSP